MQALGELLCADGICTRQQIEDAVRNQVILGGMLGTNLVELGYIDEETLARYLARAHNLPTLFGADIRPDAEALVLLTPDTVARLNVIPFAKETRRLQVLCVDPGNLSDLDEVAFITGLEPDPIVVPEVRFWQLLRDLYGIKRQLRYIALDTRDFLGNVFIDEPPAPKPSVGEDLIDEENFALLYQRRDGFPTLSRPEPALPSEEMPMLSADDLEEIVEQAEAQPPGGIERRVWQAREGVEDRRVDDLLPVERVGAPPSRITEPVEDVTPLDFGEATNMLTDVSDRDAIARVVLRFARSIFKRSMLFTVHRGVALGWDALGEGLQSIAFSSLMIPLDSPSVFKTVVDTRAHYLGALTKTKVNIQFLRATGKQVPLSAFVIPVLVRGRVVNLLYADNGHKAHSPSDIGELLILAQHISRSYESLFERKRNAYLGNQQSGDDTE